MKWLLLRMIGLYKVALSPLLGASCRHEPTCSTYTYQAIERFGAFRGTWLGARRIARCTPRSTGGFDPVPEQPAKPTSHHTTDQRHTA